MKKFDLTSFVSEVLAEDYASFETALKDPKNADVDYSSGRTLATLNDTHLEQGRKIKRLWAQHADHAFFRSLNKVHWLNLFDISESGVDKSTVWFFQPDNHKHEVSVTGFLPNEKMLSGWGYMGVLLDGRVTFASNDMNKLFTGFASGKEKNPLHTASGDPRRPMSFDKNKLTYYDLVLDRSTYKTDVAGHGEMILDNWQPKGFVVTMSVIFSGIKSQTRKKILTKYLKMAQDFGVPLYNESMQEITEDDVMPEKI